MDPSAGLRVGDAAQRNGRRVQSFLVAGQPFDRIFCTGQAETDLGIGRTGANALRFATTAEAQHGIATGVILFSPDQLESLYQVPAGGGTPQPVTKVDRANGEVAHSNPSFLPDGRHFLYTVTGEDIANSWIKVGELGSAESRPLVKTNSNAVYVRIDGGDYFLFTREGVLLAQAFDAETLAIVGEPAPVTEERISEFVNSGSSAFSAAFSVSETGTLVYREGAGASPRHSSSGSIEPDECWHRSVHPAGTTMSSFRRTLGEWLSIAMRTGGSTGHLAARRVDRNAHAIHLQSRPLPYPRWAPDGTRLVFSEMGQRRGSALAQKPASGAGAEERLYDSTDQALTFPGDWSPDGLSIVFRRLPPGTQGGLWLLSLSGQRQATTHAAD